MLQRQRLVKKGPKYDILKALCQVKEDPFSHMNSTDLDMAALGAISFGNAIYPASGYTANYLDENIYNLAPVITFIARPLAPSPPLAAGFNGISATLQWIVTRVSGTII